MSRGLIRSQDSGLFCRERRCLAEDVYKLRERKEYRRNPAQVALYLGTPVLDSALTLITDTGLYYRGRDALEQDSVPLRHRYVASLMIKNL